jgi:hypothetical protein
MARDDDSFWLDIFKKSPLIASLMAIGGVIGLGLGVYQFHPLVGPMGSLRLFLMFLVGTTIGGIFVGLILGVIADSVRGALRDDKNRKPPRGH